MRWGVILAVAIIATAFIPSAYAATFNFGGDKYYVYSTTTGSTWNLVTNVGSIDFSKPATYKITIESGKLQVSNLIIQILPNAQVFAARASYTSKNAGFVQYNSEKYECYYAYASGWRVPWLSMWQYYIKTNTLVYTDYSTKRIYVVQTSPKWFDTYIKTPVASGNLPSLVDIEVMVGV